MNLKVAPEVRRALQGRKPVVALESTIITHGMPYPENLETARSLESHVRAGGAVPATIAVMGGVICAGLSDTELEWLAKAKDVMKLSRADLPYAVATQKIGATTVAATMICAHLAGIKVFATGGIGGVHRGADTSFDISADLEELARTPVAVVCAGAKALLDLPKTLEVPRDPRRARDRLRHRRVPRLLEPPQWAQSAAPPRYPRRCRALPRSQMGTQSGRWRAHLQSRARGRRDCRPRHSRLHRHARCAKRRNTASRARR